MRDGECAPNFMSGSCFDRKAAFVHVDQIQHAERADIDPRRELRIDGLSIGHQRGIGSIAGDLFGPCALIERRGRPRMFPHLSKHFFVVPAG